MFAPRALPLNDGADERRCFWDFGHQLEEGPQPDQRETHCRVQLRVWLQSQPG